MIRPVALLAGLATVLHAGTAAASLPEMPPIHHYYGPVRMCEPGTSPFYAVDVLPGEAVTIQGGDISIQREGGGLGIHRIAGPGVSRILPEAVEPLGEIPFPNAGILQRIRIEGGVRYRIDAENNRYSGWVEIGSTGFDGSDRDLVEIRRIKFGPEARAACADIPEPLSPTPEREDYMALWLSPRPHAGPLTICLDHVAFDVRDDETALLPWHKFALARVDSGDRLVALTAGLHPLGSPNAWPSLAGPVVDDPRFIAIPSTDSTMGNMLLPNPPAIEVRIMTRADRDRFGPEGGGHVTFSFARDTGEADRAAFVRRLRPRVSDDRCYGAEAPGK